MKVLTDNTDSSAYASQSDSVSGGGTTVPAGTNYDTDNDGYGEFYQLGSSLIDKGENILGEYTEMNLHTELLQQQAHTICFCTQSNNYSSI